MQDSLEFVRSNDETFKPTQTYRCLINEILFSIPFISDEIKGE